MKKIASLYFFCSLTLLGFSQTEDRFKGQNKKELRETILRTEQDLLQKLEDEKDLLQKLEEKDSILRKHRQTIQEINESNREIQYRLDQTESTLEARDELIDTLRKQINSLHEHQIKVRGSSQNELDSVLAFNNPNEWKTTKIYDKIWKVGSLIKLTFNNGDSIPLVHSYFDWAFYTNNQLPCCMWNTVEYLGPKVSSLMYNHWAVADERGLLPIGWVLPTYSDFKKWGENWSGQAGQCDWYRNVPNDRKFDGWEECHLFHFLESWPFYSGWISPLRPKDYYDSDKVMTVGFSMMNSSWTRTQKSPLVTFMRIEYDADKPNKLVVGKGGEDRFLGAIILPVKEEEPEEEEIFMIVEQMPALGACKDLRGDERNQCTQLEISKYVSKNTKYPPVARDAGITGTVYVYFVVGKDGKVKDAKVLRPVDRRLDEEALRVIRSLPEFEPGKQRGKSVSVQYTVPVKFGL